MLRNIVPFLLCAAAPAALMAQQVELRSSDEFISVEGEIVGFNGVMLSVNTSVGQVSVPASEVICYGAGCAVTLASNNFGLTAEAFDNVVGDEAAVVQDLSDDFVISFAAPSFNTFYRTVAGAFAVSNATTSTVELTAAGQISLRNEAGNETATLGLASGDAPSDLRVGTLSLRGSGAAAFSGPVGWATTTTPPNQLLGLSAFAVITAADVGVDVISMNDLAEIYAGDITNWSQIGGADLTVLPLQLPAGSPARDDFVTLVMEPVGTAIASNVLTMADEASIAASVNQFPGSISIVNLTGASENNTLSVSGSCGLPVAPSEFNIISGDYPLVRPIMVTYDRTPNTTLLTELFDYATSEVSQNLLTREGLINHTAITQAGEAKSARVSGLMNTALDEAERVVATTMFELLFESERLSPTMTGGRASGPEGAWNRAMLRDLAGLVAGDAFAGRELLFIGLGQSDEGSEEAIAASALAASEVQAAFGQFAADIVDANDLTLSSYGFGGVAPATCYDGQVAGPTHTRIEVWVR